LAVNQHLNISRLKTSQILSAFILVLFAMHINCGNPVVIVEVMAHPSSRSHASGEHHGLAFHLFLGNQADSL
jgi:hypothetical protein